MNSEEEWRQSKKYPEYFISSYGRVKRNNGYEPRCNVSYGGYDRLRIWSEKDNRYYSVYTHILVANEFLPVRDCNYTIRHKNGSLTDNRVENLEWIKTKPRIQNKRVIFFYEDY